MVSYNSTFFLLELTNKPSFKKVFYPNLAQSFALPQMTSHLFYPHPLALLDPYQIRHISHSSSSSPFYHRSVVSIFYEEQLR